MTIHYDEAAGWNNVDAGDLHGRQARLQFPTHPRIIALCGRKRSGKDTAARALSCFGFKSIAFAEPLKQMLVSFLIAIGMDAAGARWHVYDSPRDQPLEFLNGRTVRHALQTLGTEWGRNLIHTDLWRDATIRAIKMASERRFVVTDLRFPNEAAALKELGAIILRIDREMPRDESDNHVSEQLLDEIPADYVIQNVAADVSAFIDIVQSFYTAAIAR